MNFSLNNKTQNTDHQFPVSAPAADSVFYRTYSRRAAGEDGNEHREAWHETVDRCIGHLVELGQFTDAEAELVRDYALAQKTLPSGRWLWVGGTDWIKDPNNYSGAYNCLRASTKVLTDSGFQEISEIVGTPVKVSDRNGNWQEVVFNSYGVDKLLKITLKNYTKTQEVFATPDHRWFIDGSHEATFTREIKKGDKIHRVYPNRPSSDSREYLWGVLHGIYYGDGTRTTTSGWDFQIRLCGAKNELLSHLAFEAAHYSTPPSYGGDAIAYADKFPDEILPGGDLKSLPTTVHPEYILGFFRGLMATDGSCTVRNKLIQISGPYELVAFLEKHLPRLGIRVSGTGDHDYITNYGARKVSSRYITLALDSLKKEDFIRSDQEEGFKVKSSNRARWTVISVEDIGLEEEVFCCEEPATSGFVIDGFLETGNCTSSNIIDWRSFGLLMELAMMGSGTGAVLEERYISQLPEIRNTLNVRTLGDYGDVPSNLRDEYTTVRRIGNVVKITVGDSRKGWCNAYQKLLELSSDESLHSELMVEVDVSSVRPAGEKLKGFGGTANPVKLKEMFAKVAAITNDAVGRKLTSLECCLIIDEAAVVVVAGNLRRSAGMRQFASEDVPAMTAKDNLWQQQEDGSWKVDPKRDALRMANHTRVFHHKPTLDECIASVRKQYYSGEGAIQWAGEAKQRAQGNDRYGLNPCFAAGTMVVCRDAKDHIFRAPIEELVGQSVKVFDGINWVKCENFRVTGENQPVFAVRTEDGHSMTATSNHNFLIYEEGDHPTVSVKVQLDKLNPGDKLVRCWDNNGESYLPGGYGFSVIKSIESAGTADKVYCCTVETNNRFTLANGILVGNCGEIIGEDFHCDLSEVHLNQIDPNNEREQEQAFRAGALDVVALLHHQFVEPRYQKSREEDPIVGVSFTGLFDFFVNAFGVDWLKWWAAGRPDNNFGRIFRLQEKEYLRKWRDIVESTVKEYCNRHNIKCPNRSTTVQPAGCLDRTALRVFDQGLIYADEVVSPGSGETTDLPYSVRSGVGASTAIANDVLPVVKITLKNGRILKMTPDHRLSINGQWVRADHMVKGMPIDYSLGQYIRTVEAQLIPLDDDRYSRESRFLITGSNRGVISKTVSTPKTMNLDLAYFLGALFGNGCLSFSKKRVRFTHGDKNILRHIKSIGDRLFGIEGNLFFDLDGRRGELVYASVRLYDWFTLNQLKKDGRSKDIERIPYAVRTSSRQSILAFFAGLIDCDGCPRNGSFSIDLASEQFIRNLQQVGEAVGLSLAISHNTKGQNFQESKSIWSVHLSRMKSNWEDCVILNNLSLKLQDRPIRKPARQFNFNPFEIESIEYGKSCHTYDFAVEGVNDDDSWYWQGAIKSHNTKSLLTGASSGWAPPKSQRFIRRVTFGKNDPVALACIDYGYTVVPSQSDKDEDGRLLDDPMDPRCTEWLVEIPTEVPWANLPGADEVDISQFSALTQFDFYMQVQKYYAGHNVSATLEFREHEIEALGTRIFEAIRDDEGYISAALLARFDDHETFPRLPFEPIDKATFDQMSADVLARRTVNSFADAMTKHDQEDGAEAGPAGCDGDKCLLPDYK